MESLIFQPRVCNKFSPRYENILCTTQLMNKFLEENFHQSIQNFTVNLDEYSRRKTFYRHKIYSSDLISWGTWPTSRAEYIILIFQGVCVARKINGFKVCIRLSNFKSNFVPRGYCNLPLGLHKPNLFLKLKDSN